MKTAGFQLKTFLFIPCVLGAGWLIKSQAEASKELLTLVNKAVELYGVELLSLQVISLVPSQEILQALDAKVAMHVIGNKRDYLIYKAANSLLATHPMGEKSSSDSMPCFYSGAIYFGLKKIPKEL